MYVYPHNYNLKQLIPINMRKIHNFILLIFLLAIGVSVNGQGQPPCDPNQFSEFTVDITFDNFAGETSFQLVDINDPMNPLLFVDQDTNNSGTTQQFSVCIPCTGDAMTDQYEFTIFDSFGDGICCGFGLGSYSISEDGNPIMTPTTGEFTDMDVTLFNTACIAMAPIPTLSEWGFLILAISLIIFSIVAIRQTQVKSSLS
jgi:hypothetical protein